MKIYKEEPGYLISYEVLENELALHSIEQENQILVPNISHNVEILERKLTTQFLEFKNKKFKNIKQGKNISIAKLMLIDLPAICLSLSHNPIPIALILWSPLIMIDIMEMTNRSKIVNHFELTDFCLEHALEIKELLQDKKTTLSLSKTAQEAFDKDQGFTLNHSDQYKISDLKQLKKAIGVKSESKDIWKK